jgi:hypothetical protein
MKYRSQFLGNTKKWKENWQVSICHRYMHSLYSVNTYDGIDDKGYKF